MNENPEGTPNPLNPNPLDANPSESMEEIKKVEITPKEQPLTEELVEESVMVNSLDPEGKPMEQVAPAPAAKPRKKTGLIIGLIVCLFLAVGCGVAAALILANGDKDPVAAAMKKLMSGETQENVAIDGNIEILFNDNTSPITKVNIGLDSQVKSGSNVSASNAAIDFTFADEEELTFEFSNVISTDGDLYFKLDGISELITKIGTLSAMTLPVDPVVLNDCATDDGMEVDCVATVLEPVEVVEPIEIVEPDPMTEMMGMFGGVLEVVDGEWLRISTAEFEGLEDGIEFDGNVTCMFNLMNSVNENSNAAAELYNKNPFIGSTNENIPINSKLNPVRQITIDDEKFANYINSIQDSSFADDFYACLDIREGVSVTSDDIKEAVEQLPAIYVEVDKDNNFSRLFMRAVSDESDMTMAVDLSFSYPANVNISAPNDYIDFEDLIQQIFMNSLMTDLNESDVVVTPEVEPVF